jgi:hypothetical protein
MISREKFLEVKMSFKDYLKIIWGRGHVDFWYGLAIFGDYIFI